MADSASLSTPSAHSQAADQIRKAGGASGADPVLRELERRNLLAAILAGDRLANSAYGSLVGQWLCGEEF